MTYIPPTTKGWTSQVFGTRPGGFNPSGGHAGEDIAIPVGTPLVAMAEGVVVHVGYFKGAYSDNPWWIQPSFAGYVVSVDYGPYISHYAHCSGSPVLSGKRVQQGDVVAYSGNTGTATTGPHLHWEVMPNGWNFHNGTYGRINPRTVTGAGLAAQGTITPLAQEDVMAFTADQEAFIIKSLESLVNNVATKKDLATPGQVKFTEDALRSLVENVATKADLAGVSAAVASAVGAEASVADIEAAVRAGMSAGLKVDVTVS